MNNRFLMHPRRGDGGALIRPWDPTIVLEDNDDLAVEDRREITYPFNIHSAGCLTPTSRDVFPAGAVCKIRH